MQSKSNTKKPQSNSLPAGILPGDYNTELFGDRKTRRVFAICNGTTLSFAEIDPHLKDQIDAKMQGDARAMQDLAHLPYDVALEQYAYCLFGALDSNPDFNAAGELQPHENFVCEPDCLCANWQSKAIKINGHKLTPRQVEMAKQLSTDRPDKQIAYLMRITESTLGFHKRRIYDIAGVGSRAGFTRVALTQNAV